MGVDAGGAGLSIVGMLIMNLQIIPELGLAYRPFHSDDVKKQLVPQAPFWAVFLVFFLGFTMVWAGLLVVCLKSERAGVRNDDVVAILSAFAWGIIVAGHVAIHWLAVKRNKRYKEYANTPSDHIFNEEARDYMFNISSIPAGAIFCAWIVLFYYGVAVHTYEVVGLSILAYGSFPVAWYILLMHRLRMSTSEAHDMGLRVAGTITWVFSTALMAWSISTSKG